MRMNLDLPDWLPWWVPLVLLLPALLYALAFLFMPFSVIGLKSRLEAIEARLDEIQADLRHAPGRPNRVGTDTDDYQDVYVPVAPPRRADREKPVDRPPIPPSVYNDDDAPDDRPPPPPHTRPVRKMDPLPIPRQEPRVNWPRS